MESIDTRLLHVFDEIFTTRSVSRAADALGLGQPAVSVALAKLRRHFGDPLFVRVANQMEPTPFARTLAPHIHAAIGALSAVLSHHHVFEPTTDNRSFRISMADISQLVLLPRLWETLHVSAPRMRIEILPITEDSGPLLAAGDVDFALGYLPQLLTGIYQRKLFKQNFVCLVGKHHPRIRRSLKLSDYETEGHADISWAGGSPILIGQEVARLGIQRRVSLQIPNFFGGAFVAESTDLILTVPQRLAQNIAGRGEFSIFPVPFSLPDYDVKLYWHERMHQDPGHVWLRRMIFELLAQT